MRLTQLTLAGFKSFGNRTTVEFSPGVTAVVGPNGSGKSNLLDALKWVTGGGRAREFRAEAKTDLIFHGADGKRGLGYAEVEVELSDGKKTLKVRRDLDREGASRLRLDGRAARFLDVDEALAGSGLGTAGVAVIGQGEVAGVLMADPATLLGYVAEAAGVARLAGRREQTQARLDAARLHLARLEDVLLELRERIELLRHEAEAAERHATLSREALILRVTAGHARVAALEGEVTALRREAAVSEHEVLELRERAAAARAANDVLRSERTTVEAAYRDALAAAASAQGALDVARAEVRRAEDGATALRATQDAAWTEIARLEADTEPEAPTVDRIVAADAATAARADADRARAAFETAERTHRDAAAALDRVRAARTTTEQAWAAYRARREALQHERDEVEREREALETGGTAAETGDLEALGTRAEAAREAAQEAGRAVDAARADLERDHATHAAAHAEAGALVRAAERLRAAFEARRGYAQGPRVALTSGIAGVRGSVADLFRVAPGREAAIAGALGRRAEYVVVDTAETAEAVLATVRSASGWATVLPLDLLRPPRGGGDPAWAREPGVIGPAADAVDVDPTDRPVVDQLLAHTYLVRDLAAATALARRHRDRPRLVTLEGDVVEASGAMSGGRRTGGATVLGQARDLEDAEGAARAAAEAEGAARTRLDDARARLHEALDGQRAAAADADAATALHAEAADTAARFGDRRRDLEVRRERLEAALDALVAPEASDDPAALTAAEQLEAEARAAAATARHAWEDAAEVAAGAAQAAAVTVERWQAYEARRTAFAAGRARATELRQAASARAVELAEADDAVLVARRAADDAEGALPRDVGERRDALAAFDARLGEAEREARIQTEAQARAGEAWEARRLALARREAALEVALEERAALPQGVEPLAIGERAARSRLREVEQALEALGAVNHRASADHAAQAARLESLEADAAEATEAVDALDGTLEAIDTETNARLGAALEGLREGFADHVRQLFGATAVGAIEVEHEGARPLGLRIRLQPPGKRTQSLNLLSVGERSMGALAFLFALMSGDGGGLPIAVLDEVDAPLDEANIRRFCTFVEAQASRGTQFVLITHQKATFEVADTLWGVTTEEGVSRVFGIRRDDPRAAPRQGAASTSA